MKLNKHPVGPILLAAFVASVAHAATTERHVIALKTDDFTLAETDVSDLSLGEARTVVTDSGKTVDIIRTADGFDIFVDGEQLEMPELANATHEIHHREFLVECVTEDGAECGEEIVFADGDWDVETLHGDSGDHEVIIERIHAECVSDGEERCDDVAAFGELHADDLHFGDGSGTKVIRIHREHSGTLDAHGDGENGDVIVIRKSRED